MGNAALTREDGKGPNEASAQQVQQEKKEDLKVFDRGTFAQDRTGSMLSKYVVKQELGTGRFGVVNKGSDLRTSVSVAIKTISKDKIQDNDKAKREFNILRQLDHANICKVYEFFEDSCSLHLVMALNTGGTLLEALSKQDNRFSENSAACVMKQIFSALAYLHESSFIFRDLKTENIMLSTPSKQGKLGNVRLIDFGICCPFEKGVWLTKYAGTLYSNAPELVTAPIQYDQKCDMWSAGVVMHILLSGQYPFTGKTKDELIHVICNEPVSFVDKQWKSISKEAKLLLVELLHKSSKVRCDVLDALQHSWFPKDTSWPTEVMHDVLESIKHFRSLNLLQKAAITAIAWRASDEDTSHLRQIFQSIDRDGNGFLTVAELQLAFEQSGINESEDLRSLVISAGTDGNDTLEYTEFLAAVIDKSRALKESIALEAFQIFDLDGNGQITKQELLKILTGRTSDKIQQVNSDKEIDVFIRQYDKNGDGQIDFSEFMALLSSIAVRAPQKQRKTSCEQQQLQSWLSRLSLSTTCACTVPQAQESDVIQHVSRPSSPNKQSQRVSRTSSPTKQVQRGSSL